jgi:hypothetical protein
MTPPAEPLQNSQAGSLLKNETLRDEPENSTSRRYQTIHTYLI